MVLSVEHLDTANAQRVKPETALLLKSQRRSVDVRRADEQLLCAMRTQVGDGRAEQRPADAGAGMPSRSPAISAGQIEHPLLHATQDHWFAAHSSRRKASSHARSRALFERTLHCKLTPAARRAAGAPKARACRAFGNRSE
jgi:hypothetical protein